MINLKLYFKKRDGDFIMVPELVMGMSQEIIRDEEKKSKIRKSNPISNFISFLDFVIVKNKLKKLDYRDTISKEKNVMNGIAVFKGTRIPVKIVYDYFEEKCKENNFNLETFIYDIKQEYPSLKNKKDKTILKGLMYCVGYKSIFTFFK